MSTATNGDLTDADSGPEREALHQWWWGEFALARGERGLWQVGPLRVLLERLAGEWRAAYSHGDDPLQNRLDLTVPTSPEESLPGEAERVRFGFAREPETLTVEPALADRPVVVRPDLPFMLEPGERVRLFVGTPVWFRLATPPPRGNRLLEIPTFRPSDTWFGPSNIEGELCYAGRTMARMHLSEMELKYNRAVITVDITNAGSESLSVERFSLPVPYLSLYIDDRGWFWTDRVHVRRFSGVQPTEVRIGNGPPPEAQQPSRLTMARITDGNLLVRAFRALTG